MGDWHMSAAEVLGIVLGTAALVVGLVALPTVFQMFGGAPKIEARFASHHEGDQKQFYCLVQNVPITNRALKLLRVTRTPCDVGAGIVIRRGDKRGENFTEVIHADWTDPNERTATLATMIPRSFNVAVWSGDKAITFDPTKEKGVLLLPEGDYYVGVALIYGHSTKAVERGLHIGKTANESY
jgi:hypothetical protein